MNKFIKKMKLFNKNHMFILLFCMQLLWFILLFPGCVSYDSYNQISQALGWIPFADNNPIFHSMLMSVIMRPLYMIFHNVDICIAVWNLVSNIYYFFVVCYSITIFQKLFNANSEVKLIFMFYAVCPLVWGYWNVLWKDIWISYSVLFLLTTIIDLLYISYYKNFIKNAFKITMLLVATILTLISKGTGVLFVIPIEIALIFHYKRINRVIILILICVVVYYISLSFVTNYFGFAEHGNIDFLCMFWQILGKIIKDVDLSQTEYYNSLSKFININKAKELYNPYTADPIKETIDINKFNENFAKNILLVCKLSCKYYKSSLKAIFFMVRGYLSPSYYSNQICTSPYLHVVYSYAHNKWNITFDPDSLNVVPEMINTGFREFIHNVYGGFMNIPILSYFFNIAFYNTIWILCLIFSIIKKYSIIVFIIPFFCLISCIMSPVSGEWRYAYPMVLCIPVIIIYTFYIKEEKYATK